MNDSPLASGRRLARVLFALIIAASTAAAFAQSAATGRITGRVFNPATEEFVRNAELSVVGTNIVAYSDTDGSYVLPGVPAGAVTIAVSYTGYERATAALTVSAGATATRDFELQGSTFRPAARTGTPTPGEVVTLEKFVVSNEREGNAKAIMDQRAALNMKSVVASDNFGDITGGNVGEFVKYLPGVVMDYVDADARSIRISGLDPKYAGVSIDGMRMASAASATFAGGTRAFEFEQSSIASIEAIEINKTLTASMDADAPAGTMNMRSKNAFERRGREITATTTLTASEFEFTWKKSPSPGDGEHRKIRPGYIFTYADSFRQRFGIQLSLSHNSLFNEQAGITHTIDNGTAAAPRAPIINNLTFRDNPKITTRAAIGLNLDYKILPGLVASLRTQGSHFEDEINARQVIFRANTADMDPASTLTNLVARQTANINTRLETIIGHSHKWNDTVSYVPRLEFKRNALQLTLGGGYSRSTTHYEDRRTGYWASTNNRVTRMSWAATRPSARDGDWQLRQLSGRPWNDPASFNRDDANAGNIGTAERTGRSQVWQGAFDAKQTLNVLELPVTISAGLKSRLTAYDLWKSGALTWTYVGPSRSQLDPSTVMRFHTKPVYDPQQGDNVAALGIPIANATDMYSLFRERPEQFTETATNFTTLYASPRAVKEQVDAGYVEFNTRWKIMRLNLGYRQERTRTVGRIFDLIPPAVIRRQRPDLVAGTPAYIAYQYRDFERNNRYGGYENDFLSGGVKFSLRPNLVLQVAGNQSIQRPDYNNLAGALAVNDTNFTVTLPNPELKPETSDKYFVGVQYYIEPAGNFSASVYQLNVKNMGVSNTQITAEQAGLDDDPEYVGYTFFRPSNLDGTRKIKGLELEYSQQLVFLPGWARGFSVFGSLTRAIPDIQLVNVVSKAVNGGVRFSNHKFNLQLRTTWAAPRLQGITATQRQWQYERIMFDLSGGYKLGQRYELTLSGRNILNSPIRSYVNEPGLMRTNFYYGAVWTLGVRGRW
ncbi:MAG: TonB-dependent receptor [Opitutaceae bacterium]|nr:TonB-dependent receptor [Opitutaceae bacterium]